jgi:phytoene synthase
MNNVERMNQDLARSYGHCRRMAREAASNFAWAFWLLPADERRSMEALYAFARHSDDLADGPESTDEKRRHLTAWRGELDGALAGRPAGPILPALADAAQRHGIEHEHLRQIVTGVEMDLDHAGFETFADLRRYCEHVASAVGLACLAIWGCRDERATRPAIDCGIAFQLTNILRDLKEDAAQGRSYLPREDLNGFQCGPIPAEPALAITSAWRSLIEFQCDRAANLYDTSALTEQYLTGSGRRMFRLMHATYRALLARIERDPEIVFRGRPRVSRPHKAWLAMRALV